MNTKILLTVPALVLGILCEVNAAGVADAARERLENEACLTSGALDQANREYSDSVQAIECGRLIAQTEKDYVEKFGQRLDELSSSSLSHQTYEQIKQANKRYKEAQIAKLHEVDRCYMNLMDLFGDISCAIPDLYISENRQATQERIEGLFRKIDAAAQELTTKCNQAVVYARDTWDRANNTQYNDSFLVDCPAYLKVEPDVARCTSYLMELTRAHSVRLYQQLQRVEEDLDELGLL